MQRRSRSNWSPGTGDLHIHYAADSGSDQRTLGARGPESAGTRHHLTAQPTTESWRGGIAPVPPPGAPTGRARARAGEPPPGYTKGHVAHPRATRPSAGGPAMVPRKI